MEPNVLNLKDIAKKSKITLVVALIAAVSACSSTDDDIPEDMLVAELSDINSQFEPQVVWSSSAGDGVEHYFSRIKPTVAYNKLFTASREGEVFAFDVENGNRAWLTDVRDIETQSGFFTSKKSALLNGGPVAGSNKVFIGSENGKVLALDAETGEFSWQAKVKGEVIAAPAVDSGYIVVNTASGLVKAFDISNGEDRWQAEQEVPALTLRGVSAPAIASGGVIVGSATGGVTVYILENGQQGWTAELGEASGNTELERVVDIDSKPLIFGDKIYSVSSRGNLAAIDLRSGRVLWKRQYSSYRELALSGNTLFLTDVKGHIYAIDRNTGLESWSQLALTNRGVTGPAVVGDYVVVADFEGYLHWLNGETGEIVARYHHDGSGIYNTPTAVNDMIYVQSRNGDLVAIKTP